MSQATSRFTVDLDALAANYAALKARAGSAEVAGMLKANAYGLGGSHVAAALWAAGARSFFTAGVGGAEALRQLLGPQADVYVLDGCRAGDAGRLLQAGVIPVLNSLEQVEHWRAGGGDRRPAALHVDTGMNRLGVRPEEAETLARSGLPVSLLMSHLACGDVEGHSMNVLQLAAFRAVRPLFPDARASLANSGGIFHGADYAFDMVRPGVALYGGGPWGAPHPDIRTVATLEAEILQVRDLPAGESVGYAASYRAEKAMRIGTIGVGYADGVLRSNQPNGKIWFAGAERAMLGRISMDTLAVDMTGCDEARPGRFVELFGPNLNVDVAASRAGTIAYELLTSVGTRVERVVRPTR
ncbi:MAG: alanine racemase [Caulobacteraceae bacterium]|nr:alanine racemase [Caulobacteraceae bacterium]